MNLYSGTLYTHYSKSIEYLSGNFYHGSYVCSGDGLFLINDHTSKNYLGLPFADATCYVGQADSYFKIDNSYKNYCETLGNTKRYFKVFYRQLRYEQCFHMMQ